MREIEDLGDKIQESAREREQLNMRSASEKKRFEEETRQLQSKLTEKQQQCDKVALRLKVSEKNMQESDQKNRERSRRALEELKSLATNDYGMKTAFLERIPGLVLAWPLEERIGVLDDLCLHVILNSKNTYNHRWCSQSSRPLINFTQTQIEHINTLRIQALESIKEMLKGGDDLKRKACDYLDNSLVLHFQPSHTLDLRDKQCQAEWQELMVKSPEIWKFCKSGDKCDRQLVPHFKDGRGGDAAKGKELTPYMTHLSTLGLDEAGKSLLDSYMTDKPAAVDKLKALERLFCHVAFDPKAYTRGESNVVTGTVEAVRGAIVGPSHPREDIVEPSRTKIDHIMIIQQAYRQVIKEYMVRPLTVAEVKVLSESRLAKFIPGQYQHDVERQRVAVLGLEVQSKLEEQQNFDELKRYYREKYELKF
ncbi:hypothetical protein [Endozoicomonas atrinae]|uniref:hypothetical protein n=1 Tax=Endozoicomonas atrinae TaxID=1333660 RepID=UPI003B007474